MGVGAACDCFLSFMRKFFSLIVAIVMAVITLLYVIGAGRVITLEKNFGKAGFAHFLGILISIITVIAYVILHFVPRKAYRLLYALVGCFLLSMFLVGHSLGLSAPVVSDCTVLGAFDLNKLKNISFNDLKFGDVSWTVGNNNQTIPIGSLGEKVENCGENSLLFAAAFINLILYVVGLFDVQSVLLARVKSKTYGERFVEMGISN